MLRRLATTVGVLLKNLNWACWLGQHRWQGWFELKVCSRCQLIGFRAARGGGRPADAPSSTPESLRR